MTLHESAVGARALLIDAGMLRETATLDADLLARHALGWDLATWLARRGEPATPQFTEQFHALIERRLRREPVAYIRGIQDFWGREFLVTPDVLIPRPETELIIELAQPHLRAQPEAVVVDVGTGSGCIAITLALEHRTVGVYGIDISDRALRVARANAARFGIEHRVHWVHGSRLANAPPRVDLIVANPPYVAERDRAGLSREVRDFEPAVALFGGDDGWGEIRALLNEAPRVLSPEGRIVIELGFGQAEQLSHEIAAVSHLTVESIHNDLQGIPRAAVIRASTAKG